MDNRFSQGAHGFAYQGTALRKVRNDNYVIANIHLVSMKQLANPFLVYGYEGPE